MARKALVVITWKAQPLSTERQVLLLKTLPERGGFWQPVTGSIDEGETFEEGALREAQEESGFRFERRPQYLGLEYEFQTRWGQQALEKAYLLPLVGGAQPPTPTLDPKEHNDFRWVSPAEAVQLVPFDNNKRAIERATQALPPLFLARSGNFFQEGEEITHERTALMLHKCLVKEGAGFVVRVDKEELDVVVEDTPRFVKSFDTASGELLLSTGERQVLDPTTLAIRADQSMVCLLADGLPALLLSPAYYELTKSVRESNGQYLLHFRGRDYLLRVPS